MAKMTDEERGNLEAEERVLETELTVGADYGDWKIVKSYEYALMGEQPPYDITELNTKRQSARDRINEIRELLGKA